MIGDKSVGKTSIVNRFIENSFTSMTEMTIGASFTGKIIEIETNDKDKPVQVKL